MFYNAEGFKGTPYKVKAFYDEYLKAAGPLINLQYWLDCYAQGTEPEGCRNNNQGVALG